MTRATGNLASITVVLGDNSVMSMIMSETRSRITASLLSALRFVGRLGFGRQGGLTSTRRMFTARAATPVRRAVSLFAGSLLIGTGVAMLTQARLGLTPYDVMVSGVNQHVALSFGQTVWLVSALLFLVAAVLGQRPSRWGLAYVGCVGFAIDGVSGLINRPETLPIRGLFVLLALVTIAAGVSLVVHSGSTGGAFELLMRVGDDRGYDRRVVRTSLEIGALLLGISLGGSVGPATVVIALGIGPLLGVMGQALEDHDRGRAHRRNGQTSHARQLGAAAAR